VCLDGLLGGDIVRRADDIVSTPFAGVPGEGREMMKIRIGLGLELELSLKRRVGADRERGRKEEREEGSKERASYQFSPIA
jgi:hypothetical protein